MVVVKATMATAMATTMATAMATAMATTMATTMAMVAMYTGSFALVAPFLWSRWFPHVSPLSEIRGFLAIQSMRDLLHIILLVFVRGSGHVPLACICYFCTDIAFHPGVFRKNLAYLFHHLMSTSLILLAMAAESTRTADVTTTSHLTFVHEIGLLPIVLVDLLRLSSRQSTALSTLLLVRPVVYASTRIYSYSFAYVAQPWFFRDGYILLMTPLMAHNLWVFVLQIRALQKKLR